MEKLKLVYIAFCTYRHSGNSPLEFQVISNIFLFYFLVWCIKVTDIIRHSYTSQRIALFCCWIYLKVTDANTDRIYSYVSYPVHGDEFRHLCLYVAVLMCMHIYRMSIWFILLLSDSSSQLDFTELISLDLTCMFWKGKKPFKFS